MDLDKFVNSINLKNYKNNINLEVKQNILDYIDELKKYKDYNIICNTEFHSKLYTIIANTYDFERFIISTILTQSNFDIQIKNIISDVIINEKYIKDLQENTIEIIKNNINLTEDQFKFIYLNILIHTQDVDLIKNIIKDKYKNDYYYEEFMRKKQFYIIKYKHTFLDLLSNFKREIS